MRNSTRTKLIVALLTAVLTLNMGVFVQADDGDVGMEFDFSAAPNELESDVDVDLGFDEGLQLGTETLAEDVAVMADDVGVSVEPGKIIEYAGRTFRVTGQTNLFTLKTNVHEADDGKFSDPAFVPDTNNSAADGTLIYQGTKPSIVTDDGHGDPGCLEFYSGSTVIWRCGAGTFSDSKYYVFSGWFKLVNDGNFNDGQRHIAGAFDIGTNTLHYNEIGRDIPRTNGWQQDFYVFNGVSGDDGNKFMYLQYAGGDGSIRMDDIVIYEVEALENMEITEEPLIEDPATWDEYTQIPTDAAGKDLNYIIRYSANATSSLEVTGVLLIFKDNCLEDIVTVSADTRRAILDSNSGLTPGVGAVSIPFTIKAGEDVSRYSLIGYINGSATNPFDIYGKASENYAKLMTAAQ